MKSNTIVCLAILIILTIISYGNFKYRGAASDDFCLYNYSLNQSWFDSIKYWNDTYNSRIGQAIIVSTMFHIYSSRNILDFHWDYFHLTGFIFHICNAILIFLIMGFFNLSMIVRITVPFLFAIHPIKNEAILWPCTIPVYVIPLFAFLACVYLYFMLSKKKCKNRIFYSPLIFCVMIFPVLTIEQILPLLPIVIALKYITLDRDKKKIYFETLYFLLICIFFIWVTFSGETTDRIENTTRGMGFSLNLAEIYYSIVLLVYQIIVPPFSYPHNDYVKEKIISTALTYPNFLIILGSFLLVVITCMIIFIKIQDVEQFQCRIKKSSFLVILGVILTFFPLTPLFLTSYGVPSRTTYIPMIGISLTFSGLIYLLNNILLFFLKHFHKTNAYKYCSVILLSGFGIFIVLCLLTNIITQNFHTESWKIKKNIIASLSNNLSEPPDGTKIFIFGAPERIGNSGIFYGSWALPCALNSFYRGKVDVATTRAPVSRLLVEAFNLDESKNTTIPFVYKNKLLSIAKLSVFDIDPDQIEKKVDIFFPLQNKYEGEKMDIKCFRKEIPVEASVSDLYDIQKIILHSLPQINEMEVQVQIEPQKEDIRKKYRMFFHVFYKNSNKFFSNNENIPASSFKSHQNFISISAMLKKMDQIKKIRIGIYAVGKFDEKLKINLKKGQQFLKYFDGAIEINTIDVVLPGC